MWLSSAKPRCGTTVKSQEVMGKHNICMDIGKGFRAALNFTKYIWKDFHG